MQSVNVIPAKRKLGEQKVTVGFKHLTLNWISNKACKW